MLFFEMFRHIDLEQINGVPDFTGRKHGIDSSQNHPRNGNDSRIYCPRVWQCADISEHRKDLPYPLQQREMRTDFFLPADSLLPGVRPAQQQRHLEEPNRVISIPISEMIVIAELWSMLGIEQRSE